MQQNMILFLKVQLLAQICVIYEKKYCISFINVPPSQEVLTQIV